MLRLLSLAIALSLSALTTAQVAPVARPAPDGIARLMTDTEAALLSGSADRVRTLCASSLPADDARVLLQAFDAGTPTAVTVRERFRKPAGDGTDVLAEVFIGHGAQGRVATWKLDTRPVAGSDRVQIAGVDEVSAIDGLVKLALDSTRQFAVRDATFRATDVTLTLSSGHAFVAAAPDGVTAIVWRGKGRVHFTPPDPAEQEQLKTLAGRPDLSVAIDSAFIRVNPGEFESRLSQRLTPTPVDEGDLSEAQQIFDAYAPRSYSFDLSALGQRGWSIEPGSGDVLVEFKTSHQGWLTYALAPSNAEDVTLFARASNRLVCSYASPDKLASRGRYYDDAADAKYAIEHYDVDAVFDPERNGLRGRASLIVRVLAPRLTALQLRLEDSLTVTSVSSPGIDRMLAIRIAGQSEFLVSLPGVVNQGDAFKLTVAYNGRLAPPPIEREAMPAPPGQGNPQQQPVEIFRPDPEPVWMYSGRTAWYPRADHSGYATATLRVTVPAAFTAAASGTMTRSNVRTGEGDATVRVQEFIADRPVRYLGCLLSRFSTVGQATAVVPALAPAPGETQRGTDTSGPASVNLSVLATPRVVGSNRQLATKVADMVRFFAKTIGEAPYPDFTAVAVDDNLPGGHSPAYLSLWRQRLPTSPYSWRDDAVVFEQYPYFLFSHEVAHQWWGQAVGWKNYHEQWLSEGLAQYFAVLYLQASQGDDAMRDALRTMRSTALQYGRRGPIALGYRVGHLDNDPQATRVVLYNKSAVVLDMLRRLVGDDAFFKGLRRYYAAHRFASAGTGDFRDALEAETHLKLQRFFDRWIGGTTLPRLRVSTTVEPSGQAVVVRAEQVGELFDLPLTVRVDYVTGPPDAVTIPITDRQVERRIPLRGPVRRITTRDDVTLVEYVG